MYFFTVMIKNNILNPLIEIQIENAKVRENQDRKEKELKGILLQL